MSEAALEEVFVLSSIYCGEGEFRVLQQSAEDGLVVQINCCSGEDSRQSVMFHLHPSYPSSPPDISISSTGFSRTQCHAIRQKLLDRAAVLTPEPMLHQLVEDFQHCVELTKDLREGEDRLKESERVEEWTEVLLLDHIRSRNRYIGLLEHWSQQLQLAGRLLLGQNILVILQGERRNIKEFCHRLKTVKVDVDSSGKKCKERMMKVLLEVPSSSTFRNSLQGFIVNNYQSLSELTAVFQELNMAQVYQQVLPSLNG
ncbi:RWD domain-containing protein 3 isoform X2 [Austrofundulus limnaeus]|uniref:RWD domain-containing protein 3 n=1 Tax=Austrofundulus limnaeus TaxID=52670 RepID=A0A2I4C9G5_AUSLI|nr:PREDICTED: RWD domain-containing protein 3 isoform X2 [Austrofundulus limnaeus]